MHRSLKIFFLTIALLLIAASVAGLFWWETNGPELIASAYNGTSVEMVNTYVGIHKRIAPEERDLEYFLEHGLPVLPRLFGGIIVLMLFLLAAERYGKNIIRSFFTEAAHPVHLAVFRIVLFSAIFFYADLPLLLRFAAFPSELMIAPPGMKWFPAVFPFDQESVRIVSIIFFTACVTGIAGLYSRTSAVIVTVLGVYVLGIPQFFGKIDHYHHLLWFSAVLAASRCGDAWSIDAIIAKNNQGTTTPQPSVEYQLPLRIIMVLMGVIYFFAGFWKFVIGGVEWGTGEPMKELLYAQWFRLDWMPAIRIDHYPVLCSMAGIGVMAFEIAFLVMIFFPRLRAAAAIGGIVFHLSVYFFAHINFWTLMLCYVVFVDVDGLKNKIPFFRPAIVPHRTTDNNSFFFRRNKPLVIVGLTLFSFNTLCGFLLIDSWPFAVYPTFASVGEKYLPSLTIRLTQADGSTIDLNPSKHKELQRAFRPSRLMGLTRQITWETDSARVRNKGIALLSLWGTVDARINHASSISLYRDMNTVVPEEQHTNPLRRQLLLTIEPQHFGQH